MFTYQGKDNDVHRSDSMNRKSKRTDTENSVCAEHYYPSRHAEHYYPSRNDKEREHLSFFPLSSRSDILAQRKANPDILHTPTISKASANTGSDSNVIQRYLIVGNTDFTGKYYQQIRSASGAAEQKPETEGQTLEAAGRATITNEQILDNTVTKIVQNMLKELNNKKTAAANKAERTHINELIDSITQMEPSQSTPLGLTLRKQLAKWILDDVGAKGSKSHDVFGQKYQPRAYHTYYELATALVGWVEAKPGRREEKVKAKEIMEDPAISYHLDSVFLHIKEFISNREDASEIEAEITNPTKSINTKISKYTPKSWALYQLYYASKIPDEKVQLPNHWDVLQNPDRYDVRQKTGVLHDLMHYFLEKLGNSFFNKGLPRLQATTLTGRLDYVRPDNTQIRGNRKAAKAGVKPLDLTEKPKEQRPEVIYSTEEEDPSYRYARLKHLPMYGRHSYSAVRMMGLAKQTGAGEEEISAVGWAIMAYWRLYYDHTSIPYHTAHEIMDFTPAFGLTYDPENRFESLMNIRGENFVKFLQEHVAEPRAFKALCALYGNDGNEKCVLYLLENKDLWKNDHVKKYLMDTLPSIPESKLPDDALFDFLQMDDAIPSV